MVRLEVKFLSKGGDEINEDCVFFNDISAWVLDGASGLSKRNYISPMSDAIWFVNELGRALIREARRDLREPLERVLARCLTEVTKSFNESVKCNIEPWKVPTASVCGIRVLGDRMEYVVFRDCTLIMRHENEVRVVKNSRYERELDGTILMRMRRLMDSGLTHGEAYKRLLPLLRSYRAIDVIAGLRWATGGGNTIGIISYGSASTDSIDCVVMMTDGFDRIVSLFNHMSYAELIRTVEREGEIEKLYKELRRLEEMDTPCEKFTRFKVHDDPTIVVVKLISD